MAQANVPQDAQTITDVMRTLDGQGFTGQFRPLDGGNVQCLTCRSSFAAGSVSAERIVRLEGVSDPADMLAVIALRCPHCSTKGTLMVNYGPDSTPEEADVVGALGD